MRSNMLFIAILLFVCVAKAQWGPGDPDDPDDNPGWPDDPPGSPNDDPPPWQPIPSKRPTPSSAPSPTPTDDPDDPPAPIFTGVDTFDNATMYQADGAAHHLTSPRTANLPNNTVLAVWNDPAETGGTLQIYQSTNNGFSWYAYGTASSNVEGRQLSEPHILFVPALGDETNLTLLVANAVDAKSTNIELYASADMGVTFDFVSRIAQGGAVGLKAVGNPHLLLHDNRITIYYSDQRDSKHAQKVSQQSSIDIYSTWSNAMDVVASSDITAQDGMPSVSGLPNKQFIIVFDSVTGSNSSNIIRSVNFKITSVPENAGAEITHSITTTSGLKPSGPPFVTWSPIGGANGTIVVSDSSSRSLFVNQALGQGPWKVVSTTAARAYGREVHAVPDKRALRITGGSENLEASSDILVTYINFEKALVGAI